MQAFGVAGADAVAGGVPSLAARDTTRAAVAEFDTRAVRLRPGNSTVELGVRRVVRRPRSAADEP
ncbi:MAG TPA: hypothetical protein VIY28_11635, partial [Pseudonocardiaceae bacterium]